MKKVLVPVLLIMALSPAAFTYTVSYDQKVTVENDTIATIKVIVQDEKMWAQSSFSGLETVVLRNAAGSYSYIPSQNMATKIPSSMDRPNLTRDLPHFMDFLNKNGGEKIGSEKLGDKDCEIYKFTEPSLKKDAKAWVWTAKKFPLKIEVPAPEGVTVVELSNIRFDPQVTSTQFDLPQDAKVIDLESLQNDTATQTQDLGPGEVKLSLEKN